MIDCVKLEAAGEVLLMVPWRTSISGLRAIWSASAAPETEAPASQSTAVALDPLPILAEIWLLAALLGAAHCGSMKARAQSPTLGTAMLPDAPDSPVVTTEAMSQARPRNSTMA